MTDTQIPVSPYRCAIGDMSPEEIIRFQIMLHCYLNDKKITKYELDTLTLLGMTGECELKDFIKKVVEHQIFFTTESSRNSIGRIQKRGFVVKKGGYSKKISLNPDMHIQTTGTILVDVKLSNLNYHGS
jgi:hypothetical protein